MGGNTRDGSTPFSRITNRLQMPGFMNWASERSPSPALPSSSRGGRRLISLKASDPQADTRGRLGEIPIPGDEHDFLVAEFERRGEVDRVIATQAQLFGTGASVSGKFLVYADRDQVCAEHLEGGERLTVLLLSEAMEAASSRKGRPALGVGKDAGRCGVGAAPKLGGQLGTILDHNELDQRRGVEVEDQARCSETRSETEPLPFTRADRVERLPFGIRTRPRRARESSGRSPRPLRRATGRPRRVTTISPPASTRSKYSLRRS